MTKRDLFRKRIAPIAFGLAIALMARESCHKQERTTATFVLEYGAAEPQVRSVDAELWIAGEQISTFHRAALGSHIGATKFTGALPDHDGEVRIDVTLASGEHRTIVRHVRVDEGATVSIPLERDLQ